MLRVDHPKKHPTALKSIIDPARPPFPSRSRLAVKGIHVPNVSTLELVFRGLGRVGRFNTPGGYYAAGEGRRGEGGGGDN